MPTIPLIPELLLVTRRRRAVAMLAVAIVFTTGCSAYRPLSRPPLPRDEVRLSFPSPRNLVGRTEGGTAIRLNAVTELRGSIASMAPDTMRLFVSSARGPDGEVGGLSGNVMVAVPRDWYPTVQEPYKSVKPLIWGSLAALAALGLALLVMAAYIGEGS